MVDDAGTVDACDFKGGFGLDDDVGIDLPALSQILRGFARGIEGNETIDAEVFAKGLRSGADTAYKAVMKPAEGTILTVARLAAAKARQAAEENKLAKFVTRVVALVVALAAQKQQTLAKTFDTLERVWEEYNVYEKRMERL